MDEVDVDEEEEEDVELEAVEGVDEDRSSVAACGLHTFGTRSGASFLYLSCTRW